MFLNSFDKGDAIYLRQLVDIKNDFMLPIAQRQELYLEKKLQINIHVAEDVVIYAPRREFSQVIGHIADNAMKFAPPRSSVQIELLANGEGGCVLTVLDHGHGIPVELHEKVFERYYQIDQDNSNKFEGLGLGLTISRPITRSLGGDLVILPTDRDCKIQLTLPPAHLDMP
jgi:signal transduction histidine kinase